MARRDRPLLEQLRAFLGRGSIHDIPARRRNWQPTSAFTIASFVGHHTATIPFAERYLLDSAKRRQFEHWKEAMHLYETTNAGRIRRGRSSGSEPGCEGAVRGRGLCRSHYYRATGY